MATQNVLRWNFDVPDVNNLLNPIKQGWRDYQAAEQRAVENKRADEQIGMQRRRLGMEQQRFDSQAENERLTRLGKTAAAIHQMPDGPDKAARAKALMDGHADLAPQFSKHGINGADPVSAVGLLAQSWGEYDPLAVRAKQAQIAQTQASTSLANAQARNVGQTDVMRNLNAAGIKPGSAEYQEIIRNSIKGGSPIDQAVADAIRGGAPQPAPQPSPRFQPQSFEGAPQDGNLLRVNDPAPPSPQQAQDPVVDTPLGPMPQSRARTLAFGLAYQGKGEAGKMMMGEAGAGGIGKTGQNELDKEIVAKATDIGDLNNIRAMFKPEFLGLEGRAKSTLLDWKDWASSKSMTPDDKRYLTEYTRMATATTERLNNRIKALSGAAVSAAEEKRMFAANPTMGDSPTVFESKLNQQLDMQRMAIARFNWLKTQYRGTPEQIAQLAQSGRIESFPLDGMKKIYNDRSAELEAELQKRNVPPSQADVIRRQRLKQEFGI